MLPTLDDTGSLPPLLITSFCTGVLIILLCSLPRCCEGSWQGVIYFCFTDSHPQLFDFDIEVKPILEVLVGKTIEQALLEVMEEEELAKLLAHQRAYAELRNAELAEVQRLEEQDRRYREEKVSLIRSKTGLCECSPCPVLKGELWNKLNGGRRVLPSLMFLKAFWCHTAACRFLLSCACSVLFCSIRAVVLMWPGELRHLIRRPNLTALCSCYSSLFIMIICKWVVRVLESEKHLMFFHTECMCYCISAHTSQDLKVQNYGSSI